MMRQYLSLLLVLAVLITAGCVEDTTPTTTVTTVRTLVTTTVTTNTPEQTPSTPPEQMAYLANVKCTVIDESVATYNCKGNIRIHSGAASHDLQVIARYPDNNTFKSGIISLGGSNPVSMPVTLFADVKYKGQTPEYFINMDKTLYPVIWKGDSGTAWSNYTAT